MTTVTLTVNGAAVTREVAPRTHLADFLREDLNLTSVHLGCEHGVCGACTIIVDGAPQRSCIDYAAAADGVTIRTLESFDVDPVMIALRKAFSEHHGLQCGYCTPGVLATAYDIVTRLPGADSDRIREELAGNLCRCTGYAGMVAAIKEVAGDPLEPAVDAAATPLAFSGMSQATRAAEQSLLAAATPGAPSENDLRRFLSQALPVDAPAITVSQVLELPLDKIWTLMRDVPTVVACLPGASIARHDLAAGIVEGVFALAVGPMRATFVGAATVSFDESARGGAIEGGGEDERSRTRADGMLEFGIEGLEDGRSRLDMTMRYSIRGGLSQFSRGAIVEEAASLLVGEFAVNLARAGAGQPVNANGPAGGILFALRALGGRIRRAVGL